jgi:predicted nucleic acid-binding protein
MQATYFDSSAVLSMLLADAHSAEALKHWESASVRLGSTLLLFESQVVIHRYASRLPQNLAASWRKQAEDWLQRFSESITLHEINERIRQAVKDTKELGGCRTLDAIHLATALVFQREGASIVLSSFDARLNEATKSLGMSIA